MNKKDYPDRFLAEHMLEEAEKMNPGPWGAHSRRVAFCAEAIATRCTDMDSDKAYVLGLLHDIGRRAGIGQLKHVYYGWQYMLEQGYPNVAKICLTHSYNTHRYEDDMAQCDITPEQEKELTDALRLCIYDDYDFLIQLCDSIATADAVVDMVERMSDVKRRYGSYPQPKWDRNIELLQYFSEKTGHDIYMICGKEM